VEFVLATANLRATMYGVPACPDLQTAAAIAASVVVEKFRCAFAVFLWVVVEYQRRVGE
jgi:hypothetical protein